MSLENELDLRREQTRALLTPAEVAVFRDALERLQMLQMSEHALRPGDPFPDFALPDVRGQIVESTSLLADGALVLVFFRGGWCEYCDLAFRWLEDARARIASLGATLVGVVPENQPVLAVTAADKGLHFLLLSDVDAKLATLCGVLFDLTPEQVEFYRERRALELPTRHAGSGWQLPIPAAFVIDRDGTVVFAFADPDYTRRAEPDAIVRALHDIGARTPTDDAAEAQLP